MLKIKNVNNLVKSQSLPKKSTGSLSKYSKKFPVHCGNCQYAIKENDETVCRLFKYSTIILNDVKQFHYYMETEICRSDKNLCGSDGYYFKPKN